jgi:predicted DCC family thiol-disulfide oxidoreductase YuxK
LFKSFCASQEFSQRGACLKNGEKMNIILFDGYCSLCNTWVDWLLRRDKSGVLQFASLQGETAAQLLTRHGESLDADTVIYLRKNQTYEQSTAVLLILSDMGGIWCLVRIFFLVPKFIRDFLYKRVAKNRYHFLKKRDSCRVPTQEEQGRLLP